MKKIGTVTLALALCLLCGCGKQQNTPAQATPAQSEAVSVRGSGTVSAQGITYKGECDAPRQDGVYQGSGSFQSVEGWRYTGSFEAGVLGAGSVEDFPCTVQVGPALLSGTYTGEVQELWPQGQGSFSAGGGTYTGSFHSGAAFEGSAEALAVKLHFGAGAVEGYYTGPVMEGELAGEGVFSCEGSRQFRYEGGFAANGPAGAGKLSDSGYICDNGGSKNRGLYEGATVNGLPEGEGTFQGRNEENIDYTYAGHWAAGLFEGEGSLLYESDLYYDRVGHFTAGKFTPTGMELLEALGTAGARFTMTDKTRAYVGRFPELLEGQTQIKKAEECDYRGEYNPMLSFANYMAQPDDFAEDFMYVFNSKIIHRQSISVLGEDDPVSCFVGVNPLYQEPIVYYIFGSFGGFASAKVLNCYGIPLGKTVYTNANGDEIQAMALLVGGISTY